MPRGRPSSLRLGSGEHQGKDAGDAPELKKPLRGGIGDGHHQGRHVRPDPVGKPRNRHQEHGKGEGGQDEGSRPPRPQPRQQGHCDDPGRQERIADLVGFGAVPAQIDRQEIARKNAAETHPRRSAGSRHAGRVVDREGRPGGKAAEDHESGGHRSQAAGFRRPVSPGERVTEAHAGPQQAAPERGGRVAQHHSGHAHDDGQPRLPVVAGPEAPAAMEERRQEGHGDPFHELKAGVQRGEDAGAGQPERASTQARFGTDGERSCAARSRRWPPWRDRWR